MDEIIGGWDNEIFIGVKRQKRKFKKKKMIKPMKPKAKRGIELDYCIYCDCHYQHRISAQHKRTRKHKNNMLA